MPDLRSELERHGLKRSAPITGDGWVTGKRTKGLRRTERMVATLRKRDGDYCAICGLLMRFNFRSAIGNKGAIDASIDHIQPWAKKGRHKLSNMRLAHAWCNSRRGIGDCDEKELSVFCRQEMLRQRGVGLGMLVMEMGKPLEPLGGPTPPEAA